jgi:hypothetical protein
MAVAFPFSMSAAIAADGTLQLDGQLGLWNASNALLTPVVAHLVMHGLDLVGAGLMGSGDGVGGVLDIDSRIDSARGVLQSKGRIDARQPKLVATGAPSPRPVRIDYQASYQLDSMRGRIDHSTLSIGATHVAVVDLGGIIGRGTMAVDGRLDFRMLFKLDKGVTGAGQGGQGIGGVLGCTTGQGIGMHVTGTVSAPGFTLDPTAITGLLKAGLVGSKSARPTTIGTDISKPTSKKDVLDDLLRGALGPKNGHWPCTGIAVDIRERCPHIELG